MGKLRRRLCHRIARFRVCCIVLGCYFFLFFVTPAWQLAAQELYAADRVQQGRALQAFIYPVHSDETVEFSLLNESGKTVSVSSGFLFNYEKGSSAKRLDAQMHTWVIVSLIGIGSTQKPGDYMLRATVKQGANSTQTLERPVQIQSFDFPSQTIQLSPKMSDILSPSDPDEIARQRTQSNRLWAVLKRNDPNDLYYSSTLLRPIAKGVGRTSSPFGYIRRYVYPSGKVTNSVHEGYDIAASSGEKVLASGDGLVVMAEDRIVTGQTVMLSLLPGIFLKYQHLSKLDVKEGDVVRRGDILGEVGMTGFATGSHLHVELWISSRCIDPSLYFDTPLIDTNQIISMIGEHR